MLFKAILCGISIYVIISEIERMKCIIKCAWELYM